MTGDDDPPTIDLEVTVTGSFRGSHVMKTFTALPAVIMAAVLAAPTTASCATYDIKFVQPPGYGTHAAATGQFSYDGVSFSAFTVSWAFNTFDFTNAANTQSPTSIGSCGVVGGAALTFLLMTHDPCGGGTEASDHWSGAAQGAPPVLFQFAGFGNSYVIGTNSVIFGCDCGGYGTWTVSAQVPLPAGAPLLASAVAGTWISRSRLRRGRTRSTN